MTYSVRHVSVPIEKPYDEVYAFLATPANMAKWASGLGRDFHKIGEHEWETEGPLGKVRVRFTPHNAFGIVDHDVTPEGAAPMNNPMRVFRNDQGSEVVFSVLRRGDPSDAAFEEDCATVESDLRVLKALLEG